MHQRLDPVGHALLPSPCSELAQARGAEVSGVHVEAAMGEVEAVPAVPGAQFQDRAVAVSGEPLGRATGGIGRLVAIHVRVRLVRGLPVRLLEMPHVCGHDVALPRRFRGISGTFPRRSGQSRPRSLLSRAAPPRRVPTGSRTAGTSPLRKHPLHVLTTTGIGRMPAPAAYDATTVPPACRRLDRVSASSQRGRTDDGRPGDEDRDGEDDVGEPAAHGGTNPTSSTPERPRTQPGT